MVDRLEAPEIPIALDERQLQRPVPELDSELKEFLAAVKIAN
jgi:hypothetical protein